MPKGDMLLAATAEDAMALKQHQREDLIASCFVMGLAGILGFINLFAMQSAWAGVPFLLAAAGIGLIQSARTLYWTYWSQ